jgi:glycosyltransferase involved in cell wall biosynthesis
LILTLSEFSRRDIIETYAVDPARVFVTPAAAASHFKPVTDETQLKEMRERYGIGSDYFLSLGSIQPRKNLTRLIEAYRSLRAKRPANQSPQLVIAGKRGWLDNEVFRAAQQDGLNESVKFIGYVPEEDLPTLYSGATCFVYPSYFEGFGLPVLEAMQCGAPVIAGNQTSLPEVAGDAALLFNPFDAKALAEAMVMVLDRPDFRAGLRVKGLARAAEFCWAETARLTLRAYERAATNQRTY